MMIFLCDLLTLFVLGFTLLALPQASRADDTNPPMTISAGKGGFLLTSLNDDFVFRLRGYLQVDGRFFFQNQPTTTDTFLIRRARPIFEGTVYKYFDFKIMPDFGSGTVVLQEAYLDANFAPAIKIRFGKAKTPFGLERLQSARDLMFVERSLATDLVPNRDIGIYAFGNVAGTRVNYAAGVMNGVVDSGSSDADTGQGKDFVARLFFQPAKGLGVGIAFTDGNQLGVFLSPNLPTYKTSGQQTFFKYRTSLTPDGTAVADGTRYRYSPQVDYYRGPFGILAEYVFSSQKVARATSTATIGNTAWDVNATFVLTGEVASYTGVVPNNPFDLDARKMGAFEVAFRCSQLDIDNDAFPIFADPLVASNRAKEWAVGFNWYLDKNVRFVFDYDQTSFKGGILATEKLFLMRFQLAF